MAAAVASSTSVAKSTVAQNGAPVRPSRLLVRAANGGGA